MDYALNRSGTSLLAFSRLLDPKQNFNHAWKTVPFQEVVLKHVRIFRSMYSVDDRICSITKCQHYHRLRDSR